MLGALLHHTSETTMYPGTPDLHKAHLGSVGHRVSLEAPRQCSEAIISHVLPQATYSRSCAHLHVPPLWDISSSCSKWNTEVPGGRTLFLGGAN